MGVLIRAVQKHIGTTAVGELASLREATVEPAEKEAARMSVIVILLLPLIAARSFASISGNSGRRV